MARLHWFVTLSLVTLSWLDFGTDVFTITQYAYLAKQRRRSEWRCSSTDALAGWNASAAAGTQHSRNPFHAASCAQLGSRRGSSLYFKSPPYEFAFWMCLYLTAGLCVGHILTQAAVAVHAVHKTRKAAYADECSTCWYAAPYITAFVRGLVLWEPAYQFLCMYSTLNGMQSTDCDKYSRHAQRAFIRLRQAEALFKGPCVTISLFALLLQLLARSQSSSLYLPVAAFSSRGEFNVLPLIACITSVAVGVLSLVSFYVVYIMSQPQSLWGSAKPVHCRGVVKAAATAAGTFLYSTCSISCRSLAVATAIALIMLHDRIATPAFYLLVGGIVALLLLSWYVLTLHMCIGGSASRTSSYHYSLGCLKSAYRAVVTTCIVNIPWNTAPVLSSSSCSTSATAPHHGTTSGETPPQQRCWWPSVTLTIVTTLAFFATGIVLSTVMGDTATCYAVCNGYIDGLQNPFFSVTCGVVVAVLAVWELILFAVLSRTAPPRAADDDWEDEFIELDLQAGKVPL